MSIEYLKPYELSIWEDELVEDTFHDEPISYYKENKIAIIASNDLKGWNTAYNIVLRQNKNGEKTLSFSIRYKYYDYQLEQLIENPFAAYLINERKVKLKYGDKWYDFIIKECSESSEDYEWSYTAEDAFVIELSKNGYNIELSQDLNNNQGSAVELALRTLEDTNWDVISIDLKPPVVNEPLYVGFLSQEVQVHDMDTDDLVTIPRNAAIFLFYSFVANKNGHFLQFILNDPNRYEIDDNNNIIATNYRFDEDLVIEDGYIYYVSDNTNPVITYGLDVYTEYQGYRYIYQQLSTYDPVMERMVKQYSDGNTLIYGYTDSTYTTSNVVTSFVTNGSNFNIYENGDLQGWTKYNGEVNTRPNISLTTDPVIDITQPLVELSKIKQLNGFLKVEFANTENSYVCNTGIIDNKSFLGNITRGEKFLFRYQGGATAIPESEKEIDRGAITTLHGNELRAIVAFYTREYDGDLKAYINTIDTNGIILNFSGQGTTFNNKITGGYIEDNKYWLGGVVQEPSTRYIYISDNVDYVWDSEESEYITLTEAGDKFLNYYYLTANALQAVSSDVLNDINTRIGIFISTTDANKWYYLEDVELTRYYEDANGEPLTIGNIPTAIALDTNYFYIAPEVGTAANKVRTYASLDILAVNMGIDVNTIKPIYNGGSISFVDYSTAVFYVHRQDISELFEQFHVRGYSLDKILSIEASKSNCFNILQTIAETFECWVELEVEHNEDGSLWLDAAGKPMKQVFLRGYSGQDNPVGFKYGINLNSITREVNSNEIVTKLIVDPVNSEYTDTGVVTIQNAEANVSGESYIFNFDYYFNQGLIANAAACKNDLYQFDADMHNFNNELADLNQEQINLEASLTQLEARRNVYVTLIDTAEEDLAQALEDFEKLAGYTYETYQEKTEEERTALLEIETIADIVGQIYTDSIVINNYTGIMSNTDSEYNRIKKQLEGIKEHSITISRFQNTEDSSWHVKVIIDDYIVPFSFNLGNEIYETTLNDKVFDIETQEVLLNNFIYNTNEEDGYTLLDTDDNEVVSVTATEDRVQYIRLVPNSEVDGVVDKINEKINQKKVYIRDFYNKYSRFILEGTWSSQDYLSDDLYYLDALQISNTSAHPQVTYTIDVAEISGLEGYEGYEFEPGDVTYIEDTEFFGWTIQNGLKTPVHEQVIVSEIEWHLDDPSSNTITIQNYKTKFEDLFQRIQATIQTVQYNEATYVKTNKIVNADGTLNQQMLLSSLNNLSGLPQVLTTDGSIVIEGNAILIRNLTNASDIVRLSNEGITVSSDGGLSWATAVTGHGISVENLFAGSINTDKITIGGDSSPSFRWDSNGLSAFRLMSQDYNESGPETDVGTYNFQKFVRFDQYGLYGIDLTNRDIVDFTPNDINDIKNNAEFALTWDGFFIRNSYGGGGQVEITSINDFRVLKSGGVEKIKIGALEWMVPTEDTVVDNEKTYYKYNNITNKYEKVAIPQAAELNTYFELTYEPQTNINPSLYGIRIKNDAGTEVIKTDDDGNITITGTIYANAGNFDGLVTVGYDENDPTKPYILIDGRMDNDAVIQSNNYREGVQVGWQINSDGNAVFNNIVAYGDIHATTGTLGLLTVQNTITVGDNTHSGLIKSNNYVTGVSGWAIASDGTAEFQDAIVRGEVNATSGNFTGLVTVGKDNTDNTKPYIKIDGTTSTIGTSNYQDGASYGWMINAEGDAVFNNITARGAIKTAVFEYAEIQAVGGIFIFRPSSTIKHARIGDVALGESANDLILEVDKPYLFDKLVSQQYSWCKISNYTGKGVASDPDIDLNDGQASAEEILATNGLTHVYQISNVNLNTKEVTLTNAANPSTGFIQAVKQVGQTDADVLVELEGGALVDMGRADQSTNYGIGINSSDNTVNLPRRAISLFETVIDSTQSIKVSYDYQAILGTLPRIDKAGNLYNTYLKDTQGIFTDNIYFGNSDQYITFYTDSLTDPNHPTKKLEIQSDKFNLKDGVIEATGGTIGGFALDADKMWTKTTYFKMFTPGRGYLIYNTDHYEPVINTSIELSYRYYIVEDEDSNGELEYIPLFTNTGEHEYQVNRIVYEYINNQYQLVDTPIIVHTTYNNEKHRYEFMGADKELLSELYERTYYTPFDYQKFPYYTNRLALPYTNGIYFSNNESIYDINLNLGTEDSKILTNDYTTAQAATEQEPILGAVYYERIPNTELYQLFTGTVTNPQLQGLYKIVDKLYYATANSTTPVNININDKPVVNGWYEERTFGIPIQENLSIIAGGPVTYMRTTADEADAGITIQRTSPTWWFRSDGAARFGSMILYPSGKLDLPNLATITVELGVMDQGIIKHNPVGFKDGLWISTQDINPTEHIIGEIGGINLAELAISNRGVSIADSPYMFNWRLIMSDQFGVTDDGIMYSTGARVKDLNILLENNSEEPDYLQDQSFIAKLNSFGLDSLISSETKQYLDIKGLLEKLALIRKLTVTLPTTGWSGQRGSYTYTTLITGMTTDYAVIVSPSVSQSNIYSAARIRCTGQSTGSLTFTAATMPTSAVTVNIVIMSDTSN